MQELIQRKMHMRDVKVQTTVLRSKVVENRAKHIQDYERAMVEYRERALRKIETAARKGLEDAQRQIEKLSSHLRETPNAELRDHLSNQLMIGSSIVVHLPIPVSHVKAYDQIIAMLDMCVDEQITIRADEFACYVMDDWDWKAEFENVTKTYSSREGK